MLSTRSTCLLQCVRDTYTGDNFPLDFFTPVVSHWSIAYEWPTVFLLPGASHSARLGCKPASAWRLPRHPHLTRPPACTFSKRVRSWAPYAQTCARRVILPHLDVTQVRVGGYTRNADAPTEYQERRVRWTAVHPSFSTGFVDPITKASQQFVCCVFRTAAGCACSPTGARARPPTRLLAKCSPSPFPYLKRCTAGPCQLRCRSAALG